MSADFWAGYISGAVGIVIGNPLDILKVRRQAAGPRPTTTTAAPAGAASSPAPPGSPAPSLVAGTAAPILGYGALNALLFVSYNRSEALLNAALSVPPRTTNLWTVWLAGAVGGLATWAVSTPTELIKCRAQLSPASISSWDITKQVWRAEGVRGFYLGGVVTALRDSVGYGFYFWSYELSTRMMASPSAPGGIPEASNTFSTEAAKVLLCGGLAGVVTWASIFPLDVIKTRVQAQVLGPSTSSTPGETTTLLGTDVRQAEKRMGAIEVARTAYREGGTNVFFRGLAVCSVRAFIVNAVQWAVYEWIMLELGQGRKRRSAIELE